MDRTEAHALVTRLRRGFPNGKIDQEFWIEKLAEYGLDDGQVGIEWALDHLEFPVWAPIRAHIDEVEEDRRGYDYGNQGTRYQALPPMTEWEQAKSDDAMREAMARWREIRASRPGATDLLRGVLDAED